MTVCPKEPDPLYQSLEPVINGLGMALVALTVLRHKESVSLRLVVVKKEDGAATGIADCSRAHRAIMPRVELAFPKESVFVEVSSPGLERQLKDSGEFRHFLGRKISCYRTDTSAWVTGMLEQAGDNDIIIREHGNMTQLDYTVIGKAKLCSGERAEGAR